MRADTSASVGTDVAQICLTGPIEKHYGFIMLYVLITVISLGRGSRSSDPKLKEY